GTFTAREQDFDARLGFKVADPRLYIGAGYVWRTTNYGYPNQNGWGFGAEKLPDLNQTLSVYGSYWYYPSIKGNYGTYNAPFGPSGTLATTTIPAGQLAYRFSKYSLGGTWNVAGPLFLDLGWLGDYSSVKSNGPSNQNHWAFYGGLGIHF